MRALILFAALLCLLSGTVQASWRQDLPQARLQGQGELRFFGLRIYSARLWSAAPLGQAPAPFALELTYHRRISRDSLVQTSLEEITRLAGTDLAQDRLARWAREMRQAFVDVLPRQRITGVFLPGVGCRFYVGDQLQHEIRDPEFAEAFFAIWLDPRTRDPELRQQLLGLQ
ncbi:chalcone isomerase family protein [Stutzerimonas balearica]|uniref:chalcone isomerase family protein n=1 Tax=Stutzerimonas balearica TaxID=74829 RepID=UPI003F5B5BDD